jgi:hypothetical protein
MAEPEAPPAPDPRERDRSPSFSAEEMADLIIADCAGDARAAVVQLVTIVRHLADENQALAGTASRGVVRRPLRAAKTQ